VNASGTKIKLLIFAAAILAVAITLRAGLLFFFGKFYVLGIPIKAEASDTEYLGH